MAIRLLPERAPTIRPLHNRACQYNVPAMTDRIERTLERRLRERALRADRRVVIDSETIERWIREELEAIVHDLAREREASVNARPFN
jgi:hypothetical protein